MLSDPQVTTNDLIHEVDQPGLGRVRQARGAAKFSSARNLRIQAAPNLGEHTVSVLEELGYNAEELATLIANQIIKTL